VLAVVTEAVIVLELVLIATANIFPDVSTEIALLFEDKYVIIGVFDEFVIPVDPSLQVKRILRGVVYAIYIILGGSTNAIEVTLGIIVISTLAE